MSLCESCIRNKDCEWNKGNPRHCTLYTDKEETNFERITKSPEALADFIIDKLQYCKRPVCPICPVWKKCDGVSKDAFVEWLKKESKS